MTKKHFKKNTRALPQMTIRPNTSPSRKSFFFPLWLRKTNNIKYRPFIVIAKVPPRKSLFDDDDDNDDEHQIVQRSNIHGKALLTALTEAVTLQDEKTKENRDRETDKEMGESLQESEVWFVLAWMRLWHGARNTSSIYHDTCRHFASLHTKVSKLPNSAANVKMHGYSPDLYLWSCQSHVV